jgi:hypothetical protein
VLYVNVTINYKLLKQKKLHICELLVILKLEKELTKLAL